MDPEKLKSLVLQLHQELADAEELPPELEGEVAQVVSEMAELLPAKPEPDQEHHSALEKIEEYAVGFDAEHPKIASALRQISVALGNIGI
jgi:hypothetical protein